MAVATVVTGVASMMAVVTMVTVMAVVARVAVMVVEAEVDSGVGDHCGIVGRLVDRGFVGDRFDGHCVGRRIGRNIVASIDIGVASGICIDERSKAVEVTVVMVMTVVTGLAVMTMAAVMAVVTVTGMAVTTVAFGFGSRAVQDQGDGNQQSGERHGFGKAKHGQVSS